jgi:Ni/Co efflux regulator RcnB
MKKMILSLAAASALACLALPAAAQPWDDRYDDRRYGDQRYDDRWDDRRGRYEDRWDNDRRFDVSDRLQVRIERSFRNGQITRQEYNSLRNQVADLERLEFRYLRDRRLTQWERNDLRRRANFVENRLRRERQDRDWGFYR